MVKSSAPESMTSTMFELAYASLNVVQTVCLKLQYIADAESSWICGDPKSLAGEFTVDA